MYTRVLSRNDSRGWLYLCVVHGNDGAMEVCFTRNTTSTTGLTSFPPEKHCCAIDNILYTVDIATALLNSPRTFPSRYDKVPIFSLYALHIIYTFFFSRLQIPVTFYRHFSLARHLGRIFAHAYFHHREASEQAEAESFSMPFFLP